MSIIVACRCGQAFEADAWLAGKVVQCPACRSPIAVPTPIVNEAPAYVPRPRPIVSRENKEATESIVTFLAAGVAIFVVVLGLSVAIICYLKGANPIAWLNDLREQEKEVREARAAQPLPSSNLEGPVPTATPPAAPMPAPTGLPSGWTFYEHATGQFSAVFPDSPSAIEREIEATSGNRTIFMLTLTHGEHVYEAAREVRSYAIFPGGEAAAYEGLLRMRTGELENGKVEGSKNVTVDGKLVCDAILRGNVEGADVRRYLRLIVSGNSVLQLSCTVPPGKEQPADIKAFLGNYQLQ